jgi:hypothetical protein
LQTASRTRESDTLLLDFLKHRPTLRNVLTPATAGGRAAAKHKLTTARDPIAAAAIAAAGHTPPLHFTLQPLDKLRPAEVGWVPARESHAEHLVACGAEEIVLQPCAAVLADDHAVGVAHKVRWPIGLDDHAHSARRDEDVCATRAIANECLHLRRALALLQKQLEHRSVERNFAQHCKTDKGLIALRR